MTFSQNLQFDSLSPQDQDFNHPAGATVAHLVQESIRDSGWASDEIEDWRDCGWSIDCRRAGVEVQITIAEIAPSEWMLQFAPHDEPRFLGLFGGRKSSATRDDLLELARVVHSMLVADSRFSRFRWRWDGFPDNGEPTSKPMPWDDAS